MVRVAWEGKVERASSIEDLERLLDRIAADYPGDSAVLATLTRDDTGDSLKIGLGRPLSVLEFMSGSLEPPYFASVGTVQDDGSEVYHYDGEWTEIPRRNLIPLVEARRAARRFFLTGERPDEVAWEAE